MSNFKKQTTTIQFEIPNDLNKFITTFLKSYGFKNVTVSYYLKACAINRLIFKNILNEFGEPNEAILLPTLDIDSISMSDFSNITTGPSLNKSELSEVCSVSEKK